MTNHPGRKKPTKENHAIRNAKAWLESIVEMVEALGAAKESGDHNAQDKARERIQESALEVEVRDGWKPPGADTAGPEEYKILLTTGGSALRIIGKLNQHCAPETACLEWQDWGTPWTEYDSSEHHAALLAFAQQFYFGD